MKKKVCNLLCLVLVLGSIIFTSCTNDGIDRVEESIVESGEAELIVETDYEFHLDWEIEKGWYSQSECDILTDMIGAYEDTHSEFRMLVSIPKVKESLSNADKINQKIYADYENVITATREDYGSLVTGFSYPTLMIYYKEFEFDGVYEVCLFERRYSTFGSGIDYSVKKYYYDSNIEDEITEDEFLSKLGYNREDVIKAFYDEVREVDSKAAEADYGFPYERITYLYHVDENRDLEFHTGLWS